MNRSAHAPLILPYDGVQPALQGPLAFAEPGSAILGRVTLGPGATLMAFATLRADGHVIGAGADFFLGRHGTVHIAHRLSGTAIGARVSVGRNAVVHACAVGDDCVVQADAVILDGASLGASSALAAGAVVYPRTALPPGHWCEGAPARPVRVLGADELGVLHAAVRADAPAVGHGPLPHPLVAAPHDTPGFVAATVTGQAPLQLAAGASLWFGCVVDAEGPVSAAVHIDAGGNVQDNCVLRPGMQGLFVGADTTIGHNVLLHHGRIGARALVGMGSALAPGTVVEDEVLLAAGSTTLPAQVLDGGWLWGGRPARAMSRLDESKRDMMRRSAATYRVYAQAFAHSQAGALPR